MGKRWWCLLAIAAVGACQAARSGDDPALAGAGGSAGGPVSSAGGGASGAVLTIGGSSLGEPATPTGHAGAPDLNSVATPLVRCHAEAVGGHDGEGGAGGASDTLVAPPIAGAPFDEACSPPASVCLDDLVLVYFDRGECVAGRCEWVKQSLTCRNACRDTGCQDSITTK